jgi:hypothetical protein
VPAFTVTSADGLQFGKFENCAGRSQMADDSTSGTNGGWPSGIPWLCTVAHVSDEPPVIVLAKNAAEVHMEGSSRLALRDAITPSPVFSCTDTAPSTLSSPFFSLTPSEPVRRLMEPLTCILLRARSA